MFCIELDNTLIFPAKHFVTTEDKKDSAIIVLKQSLKNWLPKLKNPIYQERIKQRVAHDLEMINEVGYCSGIENYSAILMVRSCWCKLHFVYLISLAMIFLLIIDESHIALTTITGYVCR